MATKTTKTKGASGWVMQHKPVQRGSRKGGGGGLGYFELSRRPLHILALLLPLIVAYEIGSARYPAENIRAHSVLLGFFQDFGIAGRFLPGLAMVTVLLVWQVLSNDRWRLRPLVLAGMLAESLVWSIPLMVMLALLYKTGASPAAAADGPQLADLPWQARLTISMGAGLYEELLFRMIGVVALHMVLVDLGRMNERLGTVLSVLLAAAAFAAFHDVIDSHGHLQVLLALQLMFAGSYFGFLFVTRGFGIAVMVHVLYDVFVLVGRV